VNHLLSHAIEEAEKSLCIEPAVERVESFESVDFRETSKSELRNRINDSPVEIKVEPESVREASRESSEDSEVLEVRLKPRRRRSQRNEVADSFTIEKTTGKFVCNICGRSYAAKHNVRKHLHEKHSHDNTQDTQPQQQPLESPINDSRRFYCSECPKDFSTKQSMQKHQSKEHNPDNQLKCDKCPASLATLKLFHAHARTHEPKTQTFGGEAATQCYKCLKVYDTPKQLYHHMLTHREKLLVCDLCGDKFNFKTKLVRHLHVHFGIKRDYGSVAKERIVCHQCSELVPKYNMTRHIRMRHEKYRPYKCEYPGCESAFSESRHLNEHVNIHKGVKPHVCEFCSLGEIFWGVSRVLNGALMVSS
jgi:hypothetical protein